MTIMMIATSPGTIMLLLSSVSLYQTRLCTTIGTFFIAVPNTTLAVYEFTIAFA